MNLYEAKTHLSRLVDEAAEGEEIVIAKNDRPMARLVPLERKRAGKRRLGRSNHRFIETVSRSVADRRVAKDLEESGLWPGTST